jgi:hypothetical protein
MPALPKLKRPTVFSTGPRLYRLSEEPVRIGPPGDPPPGFVTPKTAATEWPPYWGLAQITGYPKPEYVRNFPFNGGPPVWEYQGFADAGAEKQTNVDFIVWGMGGATPVAIRILTEFFHNFAGIDTQVYDITQRDRLQNGFEVVDIFDYEFMRDSTGAAIIVLLKRAMGLIQGSGSARTGLVQRV